MSKLLLSAFLLSFFLAACGGAAPADQTGALEARIVTLEGRLAELEAAAAPTPVDGAPASNQAFEVVVAQYVMDNAGFHEMAEAMTESQTVDPAYFGRVEQVRKVVSQTAWPTDLATQAGDFSDLLQRFGEALANDNAEEAVTLATESHDTGHELSEAVNVWLGGAAEEGSHEE